MFKARRSFAFGCVSLAVALSACGANSDDSSDQIVIFAAASLTDVFGEIANAFEESNDGVDVQLNFAASSTLREQILAGAPADLFASADERNMTALDGAGELAGAPIVFALNKLEMAVPAGNPGAVTGLADLSEEDLLVGLCASGVPCGDFTREVLDMAGIEPSIDTNEANVRALMTRLEADELDVGVVYVTDVISSAEVDGIEIPDAINVDVSYPIAQLAVASNQTTASAFVDFLASPDGAQILVDAGFGLP